MILQAGKIECDFCDGVKYLAKLLRSPLRRQVPVALHLDHATDYDFICEAINAGFTSVMIDASMLPFEEKRKITRKVVETASRTGVTVEAELGKLSGNEELSMFLKRKRTRPILKKQLASWSRPA